MEGSRLKIQISALNPALQSLTASQYIRIFPTRGVLVRVCVCVVNEYDFLILYFEKIHKSEQLSKPRFSK